MKLYAYGCSWTEGNGADLDVENQLPTPQEKTEFRNQHSWVKHLGEKLNLEVENNGVGGNANLKIFNKVVEDVRTGKISEGDFVVVMWSSSLRDYVPFLPTGEWISWSIKSLALRPERFITSYKSEDKKYDNFLESYKGFFLANLYNENYYAIVNQNYIMFLQQMFLDYGIKYIFCDAFESMIRPMREIDDKTFLIDPVYYFGFKHNRNTNKTFHQLLTNLNKSTVWEKTEGIPSIVVETSKHPNIQGYQYIADELYKFIHERNIL